MTKPNDLRARTFVRNLLATTCGVTLVDLEPRHDQPTADFEMVDSGKSVLVAELKTLVDTPASVETGWTIEVDEDGGQQATRPHNGPGRIMKKVGKAHRQLSMYPHPWATILHNADFRVDVGDFFEAFSGAREFGKVGERRIINIASRGIALGHTFPTRYDVDLYIWVDEEHAKPPLGVWWSTPLGEEIAHRYFSAAATSNPERVGT